MIAMAAVEAGHNVDVEREGKRFRLVCSCGWKTSLAASRKKAFEAVSDHVIRAGRTYLGETPALGVVDPVTPNEAAQGPRHAAPEPRSQASA
jgi:hypothetical protein